MIWLTWRQFRGSAVVMVTVLVILIAALALTGPDLASRYSTGIADCIQDDTCDQFFDTYFGAYEEPFEAATLVVLILPVLVGLFWGAPLITRELEAGTHLLVWNQSITRGRWLVVKLGLTGLAAMAAAGICTLAVTWWSAPLDKSVPPDLAQMAPPVFGARGITPIAYAAFAVVLGVTVGMIVRRTLPAMALTLAVFVTIQLAMPMLARPDFMSPVTSAIGISPANIDGFISPESGGRVDVFLRPAIPGQPGAWVLSSDMVDPSGRTIAGSGEGATIPVSTTSGPCALAEGGNDVTCMAEVTRLGYRHVATYHPLDRFWPFQWIETGIYAFLTVGLTWFSFWWIRRRLS